jgi:hypothetical protein
MKKIRLDLDMLSVETFSTTSGAAEARGTVKAHREYTEGYGGCESFDYCQVTLNCETYAVSECGTCATFCDTCYEYSCGRSMCDTCLTCGGNTCQGEESCSCFPCHY